MEGDSIVPNPLGEEKDITDEGSKKSGVVEKPKMDECRLLQKCVRRGIDYVDCSRVLSDIELVDSVDAIFDEHRVDNNMSKMRRDWEFFYRGLGYDKYFEDLNLNYSLPYPKVTVGFMKELSEAFQRGEIDYLMIDDGRVCDDDIAMLATFGEYDIARAAYGQSFYKGMAQFNCAEFNGNYAQLSNYRGYTELFYDFVKDQSVDMASVQLVGVKTMGKEDELFWEGMKSLKSVFPQRQFRQVMGVGTLVRLTSFLRHYELAINGKLHEEDRLHSFLLGSDWAILRSALPLVLNHFNLNGSVMAARCDVDNFRWSMEDLPLFGRQKRDEMQANYVKVPVIMSSGGSPYIEVE